MIKHSLIALALFGFLSAGCGGMSGGKTVVRYDRNQAVRMSEAPSDGTYGLYGRNDANPRVTYKLKEGDKLGFKESDGKVVAVAGDNETEIETSFLTPTFYWKKSKE